MPSEFRIQIIRKETGQVVHSWEPSPIVKDLEEELANRLTAKGVGLFRTSKHVVKDLLEAIHEMLWELHSQVQP